jgi:hypothetical protein
MNERINELFGQALDESVPETWTTLSSTQLSRLKEKFAELIVRECADVCFRIDGEYDGEDVLATWCGDGILKHFGVE